jgi:thiol-disulfide isomerase/thioredoxin
MCRPIVYASFVLSCLVATASLFADEPSADKKPSRPAKSEFVLNDDVKAALVPLFSTIAKADVSRVTVELSSETVFNGAVVDTRKSSYQIASIHPDKFTIYLKEPDQRTRIYNNPEGMTIALAPEAYYQLPDTLYTQEAVSELPVPMGPYPEPVLALSLAGVDPSLSFLGAMKSVEIVDRSNFRGKVPAIHLRGVQDDGVTWEFWITQEKQPKPLRLLVDLTGMLSATNQVQMPAGYEYQLRFDFLAWRMSGVVEESLFRFEPPPTATKYDSLEHYYESIADEVKDHPLLGKDAPAFAGVTLDEDEVDSKNLAGKVVVLDFWATWCEPCLTAMPVMSEIAKKYRDDDVVFYAVNIGEDPSQVRGFFGEQDWDLDVLFDPKGEMAEAFSANAIPLTLVIGKSGKVESTHVGFAGPDALRKRLTDELDVLRIGGRIASGPGEQAKAPTDASKSSEKPSK